MLTFAKKFRFTTKRAVLPYKGPYAGMSTCQLIATLVSLAQEWKATKITFGLPPGVELSESDKTEMLQRHNHRQDFPRVKKAFFHRRDGLPEVPLWFEINGQWHAHIGVLASCYPTNIGDMDDMLLCLDEKPYEGDGAAWIETTFDKSFGAGEGPVEREFVRVDLIIESNHSITIDLLETRRLPINTKVWWKHQRV